MRSPYVFAAAAAVAVVGAADPAPVVVYETYIDCSSTTSGMATMTNMMTETNCPHCTGGNPPMPTGPTTVYTTAYKEFCSCSDIYTDKTYTVTESCSSPGAPRPSDHVPQGFQVTTATCHVCAETPVVATLTTPAPKAPSAGPADSAPAPAAAAPTGAGSSPAAAPGSGSPPPAGGAAPAGSRAGSSPDSPASPGGSAPAGGAMPMSPAGTGSSPAGGAMPMSPADTGSSPAGGAMPMSPAGAGSAPAGGEMPMSPAGDAGSAPGSPPAAAGGSAPAKAPSSPAGAGAGAAPMSPAAGSESPSTPMGGDNSSSVMPFTGSASSLSTSLISACVAIIMTAGVMMGFGF